MEKYSIAQGLFLRAPKVGEKRKMHIFGSIHLVTILAVYPAGTMDIELESGKCFRVSGLSFI
jgi:hypothetical protein